MPFLKKEAIVRFYSLPKNLDTSTDAKDKLKVQCEKKGAELLDLNLDQKVWEVKVDFRK